MKKYREGGGRCKAQQAYIYIYYIYIYIYIYIYSFYGKFHVNMVKEGIICNKVFHYYVHMHMTSLIGIARAIFTPHKE